MSASSTTHPSASVVSGSGDNRNEARGMKGRWQTFRQRIFRSRAEDVLPMAIAHQRIYILPSGRGLAFLFSLLLMLIASINYALSLGYALCFLLTGLFAASLLHTYRNLAGLSITRIESNPVFAGDTCRFSVELKNDSKEDRFGITVKTAAASHAVNCASEDQAEATLEFTVHERGLAAIGRITLQSTYPLGLWRTWSYLHTNHATLVYPTPEPNAPSLPQVRVAQQEGDVLRRAQQGDPADLKPYQPGDAISSIAWKAAARGQGLFVRGFDNEAQAQTTHLSLPAAEPGSLEQRLSRVTAWVLTAERTGSSYSVELPGLELTEARGDTQAAKVLEALALVGRES